MGSNTKEKILSHVEITKRDAKNRLDSLFHRMAGKQIIYKKLIK